jgi:beta-ureidopropionase / N-carbamoyl-L-amino-acid hydrolase
VKRLRHAFDEDLAKYMSLPLVNPDRIHRYLGAFARIGYHSGGSMNRVAFSRADLRARQLLVHFMETYGLDTRIDAFGNVFGQLRGLGNPNLPPVLVGSHLDTVPEGGRFDGSLGVVAALEAVALVREHELDLSFPLEVVSFACEESSRFGRGTLGSGLVTGEVSPDEILDLRDARGKRLRNVLESLGIDPGKLNDIKREPGAYTAFLEIHIEQGRVLEEASARLGIVDAIAAPTRIRLTLTGRADHSGATPMSLRRDALAGAAEVILAVEQCASSTRKTVGTVGTIQVEPGAINVVPGRVVLGIDIRSTEIDTKRDTVKGLLDRVRSTADTRDLDVEVEMLSEEEPVTFTHHIPDLLETCCSDRGIPSVRMASGAGHDAMKMSKLCPAGMLLVPSRGGISHNPDEWTDLEDVIAGVQVLVDATLKIAINGLQ